MNIGINYFFQPYKNREKLFSTTSQEKKILLIASLIFGCFLTTFLLIRFYFFRERKVACLNNQRNMAPLNVLALVKRLPHNSLNQTLEKKIYPNGIIAEGEFRNDVLYGKGKKIYPNGMIYTGEFQDGLLNGQGQITQPSPSGKILKGQFKDGDLNGRGKITYFDGHIAEGEFQNNYLNGKGQQRWANGIIWDGDLRGGSLHGQGKIIKPDGFDHLHGLSRAIQSLKPF